MQETSVQSLGWKDPWKRKWQPPPGFLPGKSHGQRSLVSCSPWGRKRSDTSELPNSNSSRYHHRSSLILDYLIKYFKSIHFCVLYFLIGYLLLPWVDYNMLLYFIKGKVVLFHSKKQQPDLCTFPDKKMHHHW